MNILLDTHAFLWWLEDNSQLTTTARQIITDRANNIFFSAASGWEIAIKSQIGKLHLSEDVVEFVNSEVQNNNFTVLPINLKHTLHVYTLPLHHRDPFDRILVAQSQVEEMSILTNDSLISLYEIDAIWDENLDNDMEEHG